jgi:hypothetical protein
MARCGHRFAGTDGDLLDRSALPLLVILPDKGESLVAVSHAPGMVSPRGLARCMAAAATERSLARIKSELNIYG